jgi:hypothetical protein
MTSGSLINTDGPSTGRGLGRTTSRSWPAWLAVFVVSLTLYAATAGRGAQWQDSGEFILRIMTGDLMGRLGLALVHPLHYWLGRAAIATGLLEPALAISLVSGLAAALAVANVFGCVRTLTGSSCAALFAAASLALANTFWHLATVAEVYTIGAALLAGECWCLVRYARGGGRCTLWTLCLLNGLGVANHVQALLTLPIIGAVCLHALWHRRAGLTDLIMCAGLWLLGSLPYTGLIALEMGRTGDIAGTLRSALFGASWSQAVLNAGASLRMLMTDVGFPLLNFPNLLIPAAIYGLFCGQRTGIPVVARRAMVAGLIIHAAFALRYNVVDQHTFFLPMYTILAIFGGVGAAAVLQWPPGQTRRCLCIAAVILLVATPLMNVAAVRLARRARALGKFEHHKPYRDDYAYLLIPWCVADQSGERMSAEAMSLAGSDGLIVVEDAMAVDAVHYQKLRAGTQGPEVSLVSPPQRQDLLAILRERVRRTATDGRRVALVPLNRDRPQFAAPVGAWRRVGDLYILDLDNVARTQPATEHAR